MSFYSPNLVPYFANVKGTPINGTNVQSGVNGQPVLSTPSAIPQMNLLQFQQMQLFHAAQQLQQYQPLEVCALCNQPLSMYPIPLEFDNLSRKQLYACSEICKNLWQAKKGPSEASSSADSRKRSPPRSQEDPKKSTKQNNRKRKKKDKETQQDKKVDGARNISEIATTQTENQVNTGAYTFILSMNNVFTIK